MKNHKWEGKSNKERCFYICFLVHSPVWCMNHGNTTGTEKLRGSCMLRLITSLFLTTSDNLPFHLYVGLLVFPSLLSAQIFSGFNEFHWSSFVGMITFMLINKLCVAASASGTFAFVRQLSLIGKWRIFLFTWKSNILNHFRIWFIKDSNTNTKRNTGSLHHYAFASSLDKSPWNGDGRVISSYQCSLHGRTLRTCLRRFVAVNCVAYWPFNFKKWMHFIVMLMKFPRATTYM